MTQKRKLIIFIAGLISTAALTVGGTFSSPEQLLDEPPAIVMVQTAGHEAAVSDSSEYAEERRERRGLFRKLAAYFLALPEWVKLCLLLPLWLLGRGLILLSGTLTAVFKEPLMALGLNLLLILGAALLGFKLLHPDRPIKEFFSKRRLVLMCFGAVLLAAADVILPEFLDKYDTVKHLCMAMLSLLVPLGLYFALHGRPRHPAPQENSG